MDRPNVERMRDGSLPAFAFPGGYPMYYVLSDCSCLCPDCMNEVEADLDGVYISGVDINWEDGALYCDDCGTRIESAYTEDVCDTLI